MIPWLRRYRGLMVIVLWQAAPSPVRTEEGSVQWRIGYGSAQIEELLVSGGGCEGPPPEQTYTLRRPKSYGVNATSFASRRIRVGAVFGGAESLPGAYLRAGPLNSVHVMFDFPSPSLAVHTTGVGRLGIGYVDLDASAFTASSNALAYSGFAVGARIWP